MEILLEIVYGKVTLASRLELFGSWLELAVKILNFYKDFLRNVFLEMLWSYLMLASMFAVNITYIYECDLKFLSEILWI